MRCGESGSNFLRLKQRCTSLVSMVDEDHSNRAVVSDLREAVLDAKVHNRNMDRVFELLRQFHQNSIDEAVETLVEMNVWQDLMTVLMDTADTSTLGVMYIVSTLCHDGIEVRQSLCERLVELSHSSDVNTLLFTVGILVNFTIVCQEASKWLVESRAVFEIVERVMNSCPGPSEVSMIFELMFYVLNTYDGEFPQEWLEQWALLFMHDHTRDPVSLSGLELCIIIGGVPVTDFVAKQPFFEEMINSTMSESSCRVHALRIMARMLARGSQVARSLLNLDEWKSCGESSDPVMQSTFLWATHHVLKHQWRELADPFFTSGILDGVIQLMFDGGYQTRNQAREIVTDLLTNFTTEMMQHFVENGLITGLLEFVDDSNAMITKGILDSLTYILQCGLQASFIALVFDRITGSHLMDSISSLLQSPNPDVSSAAQDFYDEFFNTEQYLKD